VSAEWEARALAAEAELATLRASLDTPDQDDWPMSQHQLAEAIPPCFTEWVGRQLLAHIESERAA
jgi:hypothetical protein